MLQKTSLKPVDDTLDDVIVTKSNLNTHNVKDYHDLEIVREQQELIEKLEKYVKNIW